MSNIKQFIDENELSAEDVIDALDVDISQFADVPEQPADFYDGEPSVEDLAEDFDAVDLLADEKDSLEAEVDSLQEEIREARRPVYADKAEELAEITEKWGDEETLMERFDAEDEDERWSVDDIESKIELAEDIAADVGSDVTTVTDEGDEGGDDPDIERTDRGRFDLRQNTKAIAER